MPQFSETGSSGQLGLRLVAAEEEEAVRKMRVALRNPHGTSSENRERVTSAWQKLRSVATSSDVQTKSWKRHRKRNRLEEMAKKKTNSGDNKIERENMIAPLREEDKMLHDAARLGQADRVSELISQGSKVSSKDNSGYSALHWASLYGRIKVVKVLLSLGAGDGKRINRQNHVGNTALHLACIGHHVQVAAMLHVYKPDEHLMNAYDQSPVSLGFRELVESTEKIQELDNLQAIRANSHQLLLSESLDWRMGRGSESAATTADDIRRDNVTGRNVIGSLSGSWEEYDEAWTKFVERFTITYGPEDGAARIQSSLPESAVADAPPFDAIFFQDVPWPVTGIHILVSPHIRGDRTQGDKSLLLAELGVKGAALRPLIQRERLRWHPDKFVQLFGRHLALEDKSAVLAGVQTVCQLLNSLADGSDELSE